MPIQCKLVQCAITEAPAYDALSYCWGDPTVEGGVILIGNSYLHITESLHSALHQFRESNDECDKILLWVDAVCINQKDIPERNEQVKLMRNIYRSARKTMIWLGPADIFSKIAFELASFVIGAIQQQAPAEMVEVERDAVECFFRFLDRPWFRRIWIVQEVAVSSQAVVRCGGSMIQWHAFLAVCMYVLKLKIKVAWAQPDPLIAIHVARSSFQSDGDTDLLSALQRHRAFQATDPRDKIFGLLGLVAKSEIADLGVEVDYNTPAEDLFSRFAIAALKRNENLDVLDCAGLDISSTASGNKLPSWVPDWSVWKMPSTTMFLNLPQSLITVDFKSSKGTKIAVQLSEDHKLLGLDGYVVDRISVVGLLYDKLPELTAGPPIFGVDTPEILEKRTSAKAIQILEVFESWRQVSGVLTQPTYVTGDSFLEVYFRTLVGGNMYPDEVQLREAFLKWFNTTCQLWWDLTGAGKTTSLADALGACTKSPLSAIEQNNTLKNGQMDFGSISGSMFQRRMFRTEKGYIGLGPEATTVGDEIGLFKGGKAPLIIRQNEEPNNWTLLGTTYVDGMMQGELFAEEACQVYWFQ